MIIKKIPLVQNTAGFFHQILCFSMFFSKASSVDLKVIVLMLQGNDSLLKFACISIGFYIIQIKQAFIYHQS